MQYIIHYFGQAYGAGNYNSMTYQTGAAAAGSGTASTGLLSDTGFDILAIVTLGCIILFTAVLVRFWKRPARKA